MIANLRLADDELNRICTVMMDLGGPKLRTGTIEPGPSVLKIRPGRGEFGKVTHPALFGLPPEERPITTRLADTVSIPCPELWLATLDVGDVVLLKDARGADRELVVTGRRGKECQVEIAQSVYVTLGNDLHRRGDHRVVKARIGKLPSKEGFILLHAGDILEMTNSLSPGSGAG